MKKLVLLAAVLALCVPAFAIDPNDCAVLVYKVKANVSVADFTDPNFTDAEFSTVKVDGYVLARFARDTLVTTIVDVDPNNDAAICILLDKTAKEYVVISEADANEDVKFAFDGKQGAPIFNRLNKNGIDTKQDYIWASLWVNVDDSVDGGFFELDARDGVTQITSSVIETPNMKILVPKNIKFDNAEVSSDINRSIGYKNAVSATLDVKYTKLGNDNDFSVKGTALLIIADLIEKGWNDVSAADFFD